MFTLRPALLLSLAVVLAGCQNAGSSAASEWRPDPGFVSLYNGKDLTGWQYKADPGVTPGVFNGLTASNDGRFTADGEILTVHALPAGAPRAIRRLWTVQEFPKNFTLKIEFRAAVNADSGIFIRMPQLQCRDYLVAGPYTQLKKYKPQDWNQIEVTVKDNVAYCTCNGEVLQEALRLPATGSIGLEADRGQMEYRHIQIKEL